MTDGSNAMATGAPPTGLPAQAVRPRRPRGDPRLGAVAAAFTLAQLVLVRPDLGLGWDETVYVSQVSGHVPAAYFSAPRSRGISLLVAPIASWSDSTVLPRTYLAVLSGLALHLALRVRRGHFGPGVLATAGHDASATVAELKRAAHRTSFALLAPPGGRAPAYARTWTAEQVGGLRAYVAPGARQGRGAL